MLSLSWPNILANLTVPLVGLVDTAVMGHLPDPAYIGAVAIGAVLFSALYWLLGFLRMGTTGLVSQSFGRADVDGAARTGLRAGAIGFAIGFVLVVAQWPVYATLSALFDAGEATTALAGEYFFTRVWGAPGMLLQFAMFGVLFGLQQMRAALLLSLLVNLTNVALDLWFVIGLDMDVTGVALATAISDWLGAGVGVALAARALRQLGVSRHAFLARELVERRALANLVSIGGHLIVRSLFVQLPFFAFTAIGTRFGDVTLAANAVLMQYYMAIAYGLDGFAHCAETLCGFAFGARDPRALRTAVRYCTLWAVGLALLISAGYGLAQQPLIALITSQPDVQLRAAEFMPWVVAAPIVGVWAFLMDGVYIGTTQARTLRNHMLIALATFVTACIAFIPLLGNHGLWLAMTTFMACRGVTLLLAYPRVEALARTRAARADMTEAGA